MNAARTVRGLAAFAVLALVACQDTPTAAAPEADANFNRSATAQDRLEQVFQRVSANVLSLPGVVFTDNHEGLGKLVIGVEQLGAARGVQNAMARAGVAAGDYEIVLTPAIQNMATLRDRFRPTVNGVQINFTGYVCTLGFNVTNGTNGTERSFITNSHCTNTQGGTEGTTYGQALLSSGTVATEVSDPVYVSGGACPAGRRCRASDAARAAYVSTEASDRGFIAKTFGVSRGRRVEGVNTGSLEVDGRLTITAQSATSSVPAPLNSTLHKVGRTTGWTSGTVSNTCANVNVGGSDITLLCQTIVQGKRGLVNGGDSGSGVFIRGSGDNVTLVGLLWGGSSNGNLFVFSPLKNVFDELGTFTATR
jgi:hypothetical protein